MRKFLIAALVLALSGCATTDCYTYVYRSNLHPILDHSVRECPTPARGDGEK